MFDLNFEVKSIEWNGRTMCVSVNGYTLKDKDNKIAWPEV